MMTSAQVRLLEDLNTTLSHAHAELSALEGVTTPTVGVRVNNAQYFLGEAFQQLRKISMEEIGEIAAGGDPN
jgi:hypothetical protein